MEKSPLVAIAYSDLVGRYIEIDDAVKRFGRAMQVSNRSMHLLVNRRVWRRLHRMMLPTPWKIAKVCR